MPLPITDLRRDHTSWQALTYDRVNRCLIYTCPVDHVYRVTREKVQSMGRSWIPSCPQCDAEDRQVAIAARVDEDFLRVEGLAE